MIGGSLEGRRPRRLGRILRGPLRGHLRMTAQSSSNLVLATHLSARAMTRHRLNRHHRFDSVLHAELQRANAGGSIRKRRFGTDDGRERTKEKIRRRNADRRNFSFCRALRARPRLQTAGARLSAFHRGSRPKESFIARDSASGHASWDPASSYDGFSPPLPVPVQRMHLAPRS